jgi:2-polyprenyl-6-methoxyphenol hydroxylase-like FAD-dependent oxidoreductase
MRVAIIGAGPAGLFLGSALAGRGHDVVAVDRDPWPPPGRWARPGVMQFHHAHAFRHQVSRALRQEWPAAHDAWLEAGAEPITFDLPGVGVVPAGAPPVILRVAALPAALLALEASIVLPLVLVLRAAPS